MSFYLNYSEFLRNWIKRSHQIVSDNLKIKIVIKFCFSVQCIMFRLTYWFLEHNILWVLSFLVRNKVLQSINKIFFFILYIYYISPATNRIYTVTILKFYVYLFIFCTNSNSFKTIINSVYYFYIIFFTCLLVPTTFAYIPVIFYY